MDHSRKDQGDSTDVKFASDRVRAHPKKSNSFTWTHFVRLKVVPSLGRRGTGGNSLDSNSLSDTNFFTKI